LLTSNNLPYLPQTVASPPRQTCGVEAWTREHPDQIWSARQRHCSRKMTMAMIIFASPPGRFHQHRVPVEWRDYAGATPQSESLVKIGIVRTISVLYCSLPGDK
jgi:hypothetical protein